MYIGSQPSDRTSGAKPRDEFVGDGSTVNFTLSQEVPGGFESNVLVIVDNVLQQPVESYTIAGDNITLAFSEAPASGTIIYVLHQGTATYQMIPVVGSVTPDKLSENLRNFTVDTFTGNGSTTAYTLTSEPASANSILVIVDGIVQTRTTNYSLSGTTLTFASAPDSGSGITVIHLGFSTVSRTAVPDGSITTAKIADNAITSAKLGFDVIVAEDIAANAITVSEIQNGAVTPAKLSTGGPSWASTGQTTVNSTSAASAVILNSTNAGGTALNIQNSGTVNSLLGGYNSIVGSGNATDVMLSATQGVLAFGTGASSTERMRVTSTGLVGIGTSSPNGSLTVATQINALSGTSNTYGLHLYPAPTGVCYVDALTNSSSNSALALRSYNNGTYYEVRLNQNGNLALPGGAGGVTGTGITFPATQSASTDANTLDDYEEGTWTPTLVGNSTAGTYTFSVSQANYTKIGRQVTVNAYLIFGTASGGSGIAKFGGLPFTKANNVLAAGTLIGSGLDFTASTVSLAIASWTLTPSTEFYISETRDNIAESSFDISGITSGDYVTLSMTYFT